RCGRPLAASYSTKDVRVEQESLAQLVDPSLGPDVYTRTVRGELVGYGYAATGFFCSLTCGHAYAVDILKREIEMKNGATSADPISRICGAEDEDEGEP